jgi:hypothetical protein
MPKIGDYNEIMADHKLFNKVVYTPMSEALRLLDERRKDPELMAKVEKLLKGDIPEILKSKKCAVLGRQIATPNHETRMFITLAKENHLFPVFFEYHEDKFSSRNEYKHSLGQLHIPQKKGKKDDSNVERITIVDFNKHGSKKLREVKTLWGEPLIDFHRKLFTVYGYNTADFLFFNASDWYKNNGGQPVNYYVSLFLLFTCFGICFENFLTSKGSEGEFTRDIVLPAMEKVIELTGVKPLITPIGPLEIESDTLWYHHLPKARELIPDYKK